MAAAGRKAAQARLWNDYFRDPSLWWDNRKRKTNPKAPDFRHRLSKESLWLAGCYNPRWVHDRLGLQNAEEPCAMTAHKELNQNSMQMLSFEVPLPSLEQGLPPLEDLAFILHKCRKERNLAHVLRLHAYMRECGLDTHTSLGNYLVSMLVEVGSMCHAQQVFDRLAYRYECSWNALITGYIKCGESQHALELYQKMQENDSLRPSGYTFVALLKACTMLNDLERGRQIHSDIDKGLLEEDVFVGSTLIDMYAKCGALATAQEVFEKLRVRNIVSWNALIAGYVEHGYGGKALNCYEQMQHEDISPDAVTLVCSLKACGSIGATVKGREVHAEIVRTGLLESDIFLGSTLVDMYAKCGSLAEAQEVFDNLPVRNVVSWNALIAGYVEDRDGEEALNCFEQMQHEGMSPDAVTLVCSLKACGSLGAIVKAQQIQDEITRKGLLEGDHFLGSILVDAYAKCGWLADAQSVFAMCPVRDVVLWNALIAGYAEHGCGEEALNCLDQMQQEGISLNAVTLVCSLKACGSTGSIVKGQEIHAEIARKGLLERDAFVGSTLLDFYVKCGSLKEAQKVFDKLPFRDVVSWNALVAGYGEHGRGGEEAFNCVEQMQHEGLSPDAVTFVCSLKACGSVGATVKGHEMHAEISKKGLLDSEVGSTLLDMYAKCGLLAEAQEVFDKLPVRSVVSWNALISGYAEHGHGKEAIHYFEQRQHEGIFSDTVTLVCILKACGSIGATAEGREIHVEIVRRGLERELLVGNTLVDFYAKCCLLVEAQELFYKLPVPDVVSWTALIAGYADHGCGEEALHCFEQMQDKGVSGDAVTFVCSLTACGNIGATVKSREIHAEVARKGLLDREAFIGSALVDVYAKCGLLAEAQKVFDNLLVRDMVSWNALITGYAEHGCSEEALSWFEQMQHEGIFQDAFTLVCSLKSCGSIGATVKGQEIHAEIARKGLEKELLVGNTLVNMYVKCGLVAAAQEVFDKLPIRDIVSWNSLVAGYGQLGESENVFRIFDRMTGEGMRPDLVTFSSVLNACSHAGLVDKGQMYFEAISNDHGFLPTLDHYTCMVDLLGRAGHIDKAVAMTKKMPFHPGIVAWRSVLGACRKWGNVELGRHAFENVVALDEKDAAAYVCMSNIFADGAMQ